MHICIFFIYICILYLSFYVPLFLRPFLFSILILLCLICKNTKIPYQQYTVSNFTFSIYTSQSQDTLIVDCVSLPRKPHSWLGLLRFLPLDKNTSLIIAKSHLWTDKMYFSLPHFINRHHVFIPNRFSPQLAKPCDQANSLIPNIQCNDHGQHCSCKFTPPLIID